MANPVSASIAASIASGGPESVGFLNDIIRQLWDYINVAGGKMTKEIVEPMFAQMLPGPLSALHFEKIDLGKRPIIFDNVDVHSRHKGVIKLDIDIAWDGDCDIQLGCKFIGSFGVRSVKMTGRMSVVLTPLIERIPIVAAVQLAFINPPNLHIDFTGLAEVAEFSLIEKTLYKIIDKILAGILVLPSRMLVKLDPTAAWYDTFLPDLGVIRVNVKDGHGFTVPKGWFKDVPDIFCKVRLGAFPEWETRTIRNNTEPQWDERADFILSDHDQAMLVEAWDDDKTNVDDALGKSHITVGKLLVNGKKAELPMMVDNEDTGAKINIECEVMDFVSDLSSFQEAEHAEERLLCGLLTILISGVRNLPVQREEAASCVKVAAFDKNFSTGVVVSGPAVDGLNPSYDVAFRVPLHQSMLKEPSDITMTLMNKRDKLGKVTVPFGDVMEAENAMLTSEFALGNGAVILARLILRGIKVAKTS